MVEEEIELFVPGRLCLFGEHSDWAGGHRRQNPKIEKGYAIVAPTNQGTYAKVRKLEKPLFRFKSSLSDEVFEIELNPDKLLEVAEEGDVFSYVAGVVHEIICSYHGFDEGIEIDNYKTDLPTKKGLSSSASICVLIAKAFGKMYGLNFTIKRIMELAYFGEITTPSRCGKLDQACAYENPVLMEFDGDRLNVEELKIDKEINLLIVDLMKNEKSTVKILADLSEGFPWTNNDIEKGVQQYLGVINKGLVMNAKLALEKGDSMMAGCLMNLVQGFFDTYLTPACPEELEAPVLHSVLEMPEIQDFISGGKCVGSGGEGSAQFVCKSKEDREKAKQILESKGFECLELDLKPSKKLDEKISVIIPAAGFGSRLYPLTENKPKALLEIQGRPLIDYIINKINEIGCIDKIIIVTNNRFYDQFLEWKNKRNENIKIINNHVNNEQEALSGFGDLMLALNNEAIERDVFVLGGDNFFDCSLREVYDIFKREGKDVAICYDVGDVEKAKSLGVAKVEDNLIIDFKEKPENPKSTICSTSAYFYKKETLELIRELAEKRSRGHLGMVIEHLYQIVPLYAHITRERWIDINDREALKKADPTAYGNLSL